MQQRKVSTVQPQSQKRQAVQDLYPPQMAYRTAPPRRLKRQQGSRALLLGATFLFALVAFFGLYGFLRRPAMQTPFVLVDLRALEESGHPVTGARVSINKDPMGVTDSFGEWRRYLRLKAGDKIAIEVKKDARVSLLGTKTLKVPSKKTEGQSLEVKATIELRSSEVASVAEDKVRESIESTPQPTETRMSELSEDPTEPKPDPDLKALADKSQGADDNPDTNDASMGIYFDDGLSAVSVQAQTYPQIPANLLERHQAEIVQDKITPLMVGELQKLGLHVDKQAAWRVVLSYIPKADQVGYIRAGISWRNPFGQTEQTAFIAGFAKTFEETSRSLAALLRLHMKKSFWAFKDNGAWFIDEDSQTSPFWSIKPGTNLIDTNGQRFALSLQQQREKTKRWRVMVAGTQPCQSVRQRLRCLLSTQSLKEAPPLVGWRQKSMVVQGVVPRGAEVFVAGFQAQASGDGRYLYWGHPGSNHKTLIVSNGKVVHSEIFVDQPAVQTVVKLMPQGSLRQARR